MRFNMSIELPDGTITPEEIMSMFGEKAGCIDNPLPDNIEIDGNGEDVYMTIYSDEDAHMNPFAYGNVVRVLQNVLCRFNTGLDEAVYPSIIVRPYLMNQPDVFGVPKMISTDYNYADWANPDVYGEAKKQDVTLRLEFMLPNTVDVTAMMQKIGERFPQYFDRMDQDELLCAYRTEDWFSYAPVALYVIDTTEPMNYPIDDVDKEHPGARPIGIAQGILDTVYTFLEETEEKE